MDKITIRNPATDAVLVLDYETVPGYILKSVDWGTIEADHNSSKYIGQIGESITGVSLGTRAITIEGWIVTQENPTVMKSLKTKLNKFINPLNEFDLLYEDYIIHIVFDSTVSYSKEDAENNDTLCKFQLTGIAFDPVFRYQEDKAAVFATLTPVFHFPLIIPDDVEESGIIWGERSDSLISSIVNDGDLPIGGRILFKAKGNLSNPYLINITTQETLKLQKNLVAGEEIEIVTSIGQKSVTGKLLTDTSWNNYFQYFSLDNSWMQFPVGSSLLRYGADSGIDNLEVTVYYKPEFLEVQQ